MTQPRIEVMPIAEAATLDLLNTNKHTARGRGRSENSMRRRGMFRPIAAAGKGVDTPVIGAGNQTYEIAVDIGIKEAIVVHTRGDQIIINVRDDIEPGSAEFHALSIEDNITALDHNPDVEILAALASGDNAVLKALRADDKILNGMIDEMGTGDELNEYSRNIEAPIYTPKGEKPKASELYDATRTQELMEEIEAVDLPDEEKAFLRIAAQRHTVLNFKKIAEYYAHANEAVQALMENSALIIIDFNRAIELGYVKLSEKIADQYKEDYPDA